MEEADRKLYLIIIAVSLLGKIVSSQLLEQKSRHDNVSSSQPSLSPFAYMNSTATTFALTQMPPKAAVYNWHVLSLSLFSISGAFGNILVCLTIRRDPALQTKTNYYLFSLAIADLAVCLVVIPFSVIQDFSGK